MSEAPSSFRPIRGPADFKSLRFDPASESVAYFGLAAPGAAESDPLWQVRRYTFDPDGSVVVEWADGEAYFTKIWANRASLNYL